MSKEPEKKQYNEKLEILNGILKERKWTLYRLAKEADLPYSTLRNLYVRNTEPTFSTLKKICDGLNIDMQVFLSGDTSDYSDFAYTSEEKRLIVDYRELKKSDKALLKAYLAGLRKELPTFKS